MIVLQKNWKLWIAATLTTLALAIMPWVNVAHACLGANGSGGGC